MGINPNIPMPEPFSKPAVPTDPSAAGQLSDLPSELQTKIFSHLSKKDALSAQSDRQLREIATDKTRREETAAMKEAVTELKQHVLNTLELWIPQSSDDPKSAEVAQLALGICNDMDKIVSSNPISDSTTVSHIRDNINAKKHALINSLSKLSEPQLNALIEDLKKQNKYTGMTSNVVDSALKEVRLKELRAEAEKLASYHEGVAFLQKCGRMDPTHANSIDIGEKNIKNYAAKTAFFLQLATETYESKNHAKLFETLLKLNPYHQGANLHMFKELLEDDPALKATYAQKLKELSTATSISKRLNAYLNE